MDKPNNPLRDIAIQAPTQGDAADKRVYWRSRRGMTELEQQLLPYVVACYPSLPPEQKALYAQLLEHEDWDIFDWLQGREVPPDPALQELVAKIIRFGMDGTGAESAANLAASSQDPPG